MVSVGDSVRFVRTSGVTSPRMAAYVGEVGLVRRVFSRDKKLLIEVSFRRAFENDSSNEFTLKEAEWEMYVPPAPEEAATTEPVRVLPIQTNQRSTPPTGMMTLPGMPPRQVIRVSYQEFRNANLRRRNWGMV